MLIFVLLKTFQYPFEHHVKSRSRKMRSYRSQLQFRNNRLSLAVFLCVWCFFIAWTCCKTCFRVSASTRGGVPGQMISEIITRFAAHRYLTFYTLSRLGKSQPKRHTPHRMKPARDSFFRWNWKLMWRKACFPATWNNNFLHAAS